MISKTLHFLLGRLVVSALVAVVGLGLVAAATGSPAQAASDDDVDVIHVNADHDHCGFDIWDDGHDHDDDHDDWWDDDHDGHDHDGHDHDGHDHDDHDGHGHDGHDHDGDNDVKVIFLGDCNPAPAAPALNIIFVGWWGGACPVAPAQTLAGGIIVIGAGCPGVGPAVMPQFVGLTPPAGPPGCMPGYLHWNGTTWVKC